MPVVPDLPSDRPPLPVGRIVHKADFEAMLSTPALQRSAHFALHHLPAAIVSTMASAAETSSGELSTDHAPTCTEGVDKIGGGHWLGVVVPKRHARRSVTRSLLKRQMRQAFLTHAADLAAGRWLLRVKAPYPAKQFISAASAHLRGNVHDELQALMQAACRAGSGRVA